MKLEGEGMVLIKGLPSDFSTSVISWKINECTDPVWYKNNSI